MPDDGNRYEVIAGLLYTATVPSTFHHRIVAWLLEHVGFPAHERGLAYPTMGPVGVLMPG